MSEHHGFMDSLKGLKSLVVEDDPASTPVEKPVYVGVNPLSSSPVPFSFGSQPTPTNVGVVAPISSFVSDPTPGVEDDAFYKKLADKTDFEKTDVATTIHKFLDPLANLPLDSTMKFKTAIAQAKSNAGVTEEAILSTFDSLKATLTQEQEAFNQKATVFEEKSIKARQSRIAEIQAQIAQLQEEQVKVSTDLAEAQTKAARTQSGFKSAILRRSAEIDMQKSQYETMLK